MRDVPDRLEALGVSWYITGSEALRRYGEPRQTGDLDIVVDMDTCGFERIAPQFEDAYAVADAVDFGGHVMASLIPFADFGKVDVILKGRGHGPSRSWIAGGSGSTPPWVSSGSSPWRT